MATRNFYVEGSIDGRATELTGGPRNKNGGMTLHITQRDRGAIVKAFDIDSIVGAADGKLYTRIFDRFGNQIASLVTER